jgi:Family of unknown function (DUF6114)
VTIDGVPDEVTPQAPPEASTTGTATEPGRWSWLRRARLAWRHWRRTRPFWGGGLLIASGVWILGTVKAPLPVILHIGAQGTAAFVVPLLILLSGLLLWFNPQQRLFYSIIGLLMSLASWVTSNLGGFIVGLLLGMVGGSLAFSWTPDKPPRKEQGQRADEGDPEPEPDAGMDLVVDDDRYDERRQGRPVG